MYMKTTKRLLAMLLVLAMLLSNLPAAALAEEFAELVSEEPASDVIVPEETETQPAETEAPETDPPETANLAVRRGLDAVEYRLFPWL